MSRSAEALLRADDAALARFGERYVRSTVAGLLANALETQGKIEEAEAYVALTLELADEADANSQVLARIARAKLDARHGLADAALGAASDALELADTTADIDFQGDVHADFGLILARLERMPGGAGAVRARAPVLRAQGQCHLGRERHASDRVDPPLGRCGPLSPTTGPCRCRGSGSSPEGPRCRR